MAHKRKDSPQLPAARARETDSDDLLGASDGNEKPDERRKWIVSSKPRLGETHEISLVVQQRFATAVAGNVPIIQTNRITGAGKKHTHTNIG